MSENFDLEHFLQDEGVAYRNAGRDGVELQIKECPRCSDNRSKTYFNTEKGRGLCFACDARYTTFSLVRDLIGTDNHNAARIIAEFTGEQSWKPKRQALVAVEDGEVKLPASVPLPHNGTNLKYLRDRGITDELTEYFRLRYSEHGWFAGQDFGARVIIPIYDLCGDLVTFQGRAISDDADRKYLFPIGLRSSGFLLFNGLNAVKAKRIVIGEGVFDVIAIKKALDTEPSLSDVVPVGTFGKHLSFGEDGQLSRLLQLKEYGLEQVTFMWDGEKQALSAAISAGEKVKRYGLNVRVALLPKDKDPNECNIGQVQRSYNEARELTTQQIIKWKLRSPYE